MNNFFLPVQNETLGVAYSRPQKVKRNVIYLEGDGEIIIIYRQIKENLSQKIRMVY
jgi:hypothetical protein